jgi:hypothetical protein
MQKVVGSSPIIRFAADPLKQLVLSLPGESSVPTDSASPLWVSTVIDLDDRGRR